jgi:hypothetical protein
VIVGAYTRAVGCCTPSGYDRIFDERQARRDAQKYRRKGLGRPGQWVVEAARAGGVVQRTVLEIGGGVGAIQLELLKAGAARSVDVELSPEYEPVAAELLREARLEERVERRLGDFVRDRETFEAADDVVLHRVVCCYHDPEALVGAAAERARRRLVLTFPPDALAFRLGSRVVNVFFALTGTEFRTYVHPVATILGAARSRGLEPVFEARTTIWRVVGMERA